MLIPRYRYELRRGDRTIATGHLSTDEPLRVGDTIAINGTDGIIRAIDPLLGEFGSRLIIELTLVGSSPS